MRSIVRTCLTAAALAARPAFAQPATLPFDTVSLADLRAFQSPAASWRIVSDATADRTRVANFATTAGAGMLVNVAAAGQGANLATTWEHGDIDLELDVMIPKGTDSGIYLQGRYEVQLADGPGGRMPTAADVGAIDGHPPRVNAGRATGLWQTLKIRFAAPRFDAQGRKVADARFVRVEHDGVVVHENVRVGAASRGAPFQDERAMGPLVLQGTGGPVAFRNVRVKRYAGAPLSVANLRYRVAEGTFDDLAAASAAPAVRQGPTDGIATSVGGATDKLALTFDGTLRVPNAGRYLFDLGFDWVDEDPQFKGTVIGGGRLVIGGREVLVHPGRLSDATAVVDLPAGEQPFTLTFYKNRPWTNKSGVMLFVEGSGVARQALHTVRPPDLPGAITVEPAGEPEVLRSFVRYGSDRRTHAVSVGDPAGVHFSYDLDAGTPLSIWRGPFAETTEMWHERGNEQVMRPLGSVVTLDGAPSLAVLADDRAAWPDSAGAALAFDGYALDRTGHPAFLYHLRDVAVEDRLRPEGTSLHRELRLRGPDATDRLFVRLASASRVRRLADGSYLVGDGGYYVVPDAGAPALVVRDVAGGQELIAPVRIRRGESVVAYTLVW